ncbi:MAG: glucose 1-dehydrogenase [Alphaproteobacteria bacterium]
MGRLSGKTAFITGGARGIGAATAKLYAAEGAAVALSDIDGEGAAALAAELSAQGAKAVGFRHDVASEADWADAMARVAALGPLDVLVNNAGILMVKLIADTTLDDFRRMEAINVEGVFLGIKAAFAAMGARGGAVINLSSIAGLMGSPGHIAYNASKGAVRLMTKSAAMEAAALGWPIRVNSIHPGVMATEMTRVHYGVGADNAATDNILNLIPSGRFGTAGDVAEAALYLASDASAYVNGAELVVDGGWMAGRTARPQPA